MGRKWAMRATVGRLCTDDKWQYPNEIAASASRAAFNSAYRRRIVSGNKAETGSSHGAGLAGHGLGEALTLQGGRQVHFAAGGRAGGGRRRRRRGGARAGRRRGGGGGGAGGRARGE